jgi:Bifunctional DNA primase/polymerase, N-terminal
MHLGYRARQGVDVGNRVRIKGRPIDLRASGGYAIVPNSVNAAGVAYRWLSEVPPLAELPLFKVSWTRERRKQVKTAVADVLDPDNLLRRGRAYVEKLPVAVSGSNGHTTTFVAAIKIVKFVAFHRDLAWQLLLHYNATRCEPPWDVERELRHKLEDALVAARR